MGSWLFPVQKFILKLKVIFIIFPSYSLECKIVFGLKPRILNNIYNLNFK